jgi:hypothetical protein
MAEPESKRVRTEPGEPASAAGGSTRRSTRSGAPTAWRGALHWPRWVAEHAGTLKNWIQEKSGEAETE